MNNKNRIIDFTKKIIPKAAKLGLNYISMIFKKDGEVVIQFSNRSRKAHWEKSNVPGEEFKCSKCGGACWYYDFTATIKKSQFCPNCGAEMEEDDDEISLQET